MSKTPETDKNAFCAEASINHPGIDVETDPNGYFVEASFARTLETQRDEARAEVERLRKTLESIRDISISMVDGQKTGCASAILNEGPRRIKDKANQALTEDFALPTQREIFEAHGREFYSHDGQTCPCENGLDSVQCIYRHEIVKGTFDPRPEKAEGWQWKHSVENSKYDIIGWRPADAPEKLPRK